MTKDEIMRMAREAGMPDPMVFIGAYERFASMVAAAEREACAQVVDDFGDEWMCDSHELSKIIRARGQK